MAAAGLAVRRLDAESWPAYAAMMEAHNGVYGGCWCLGFHPEAKLPGYEARRAAKEARVRAGSAHAALVFDGEACVGWCQFGSPAELPHIKNRKAYEADPPPVPPTWRITCFFVARGYRRKGVAVAALDGALAEIGALGGGRVEAYPEASPGRGAPPVAMHGGTLAMFERAGFARDRKIGKNKWVVTAEVPAAPGLIEEEKT